MRTSLLVALALLGAAPAWAAEEPSGCDKFKWPNRARARGARRHRIAPSWHQAASLRLALAAGSTPGAARLRPICRRRPSVRPRRHLCRLTPASRPPKAGLYTVSLSIGGWLDLVQDGHFLKPKAFSGATDCDGIRKTMKYELSAEPVRAAGQRDHRGFSLDCHPADRIAAICRQTAAFTPAASLLLSAAGDIPIGRKSIRDYRNGASACRTSNPTNA